MINKRTNIGGQGVDKNHGFEIPLRERVLILRKRLKALRGKPGRRTDFYNTQTALVRAIADMARAHT